VSISFGEESHRLCHCDHFKLAKRILRFALDAQLRQEVGAANRARIAMFFSPERMCRTAADVLSRRLQAT
jgi:glycosyltransferase involved in cell wall biosynthesis